MARSRTNPMIRLRKMPPATSAAALWLRSAGDPPRDAAVSPAASRTARAVSAASAAPSGVASASGEARGWSISSPPGGRLASDTAAGEGYHEAVHEEVREVADDGGAVERQPGERPVGEEKVGEHEQRQRDQQHRPVGVRPAPVLAEDREDREETEVGRPLE